MFLSSLLVLSWLPLFIIIEVIMLFFFFFCCLSSSVLFYHHLQSVTKIMGKTVFWITSCFYPLPPLTNAEKQCAKLATSYVMGWKFASGYVMGSQHCIGGEGGFLRDFLKFSYFVTDCSLSLSFFSFVVLFLYTYFSSSRLTCIIFIFFHLP